MNSCLWFLLEKSDWIVAFLSIGLSIHTCLKLRGRKRVYSLAFYLILAFFSVISVVNGNMKDRQLEGKIEDVQNKVINRQISKNDRDKILSVLQKIPKGEIIVSSLSGDLESNMLAAEYKKLFDEAGWKTDIEQGANFEPGHYVAFSVQAQTDEEATRIMYELGLNVFRYTNLEIPIGFAKVALQKQKLVFWVGPK